MSMPEVADSPSWEIPYYKQTEVGAYFSFLRIVQRVGVQITAEVEAEDGWERHQTLYEPVVMPVDTEGNPGPWELQLMQDVRFMAPDIAAANLPSIVSPSVVVSRRIGGRKQESEIMRPSLHVYFAPPALPRIFLARSTAYLRRQPMDERLQRQARYVTWLDMAERQLAIGRSAK